MIHPTTSSLKGKQRDERGETLAFLVLWPVFIVAILVLLVHTFIVVNAQAEAELAASAGLRAAWRSAADTGLRSNPAGIATMATEAKDAAAEAAARGDGWRWWTPGITEVRSNWCSALSENPAAPQPPAEGQAGWVEITVSGDVLGPLAALWPDQFDRVSAVANGPAALNLSLEDQLTVGSGYIIPNPDQLSLC